MRFSNLQGIEIPCCYIKDTSKFTSTEDIKHALDNHTVPEVCSGCRQLYEDEDLSKVFQI